MLTGVLDWLLGINVNRSLARPIYATTPRSMALGDGPILAGCPANRNDGGPAADR
ncbi:MAG: hypothetical protein VB124_02190 [Burkholderia sp.]